MKGSIKIAHYPASFLPTIGGAELIVHNLAEAQAMKGHDVYVFGTKSTKIFFKKLNISPKYKLLVIPKYVYALNRFISPYSLFFYYIIRKLVNKYQEKYNFQIWHMNLISEYSITILKALNSKKTKFLGTFRGSDIQRFPEINYGKRLNPSFENLLKRNIKKFDYLSAISKTVYDEYIELGYPSNQIAQIPNFIDLKRYKF